MLLNYQSHLSLQMNLAPTLAHCRVPQASMPVLSSHSWQTTVWTMLQHGFWVTQTAC